VAITNTPGKAQDARDMGADEVLVVKNHVGKELQAMGGADVILSFSPAMKQNSEAMEGASDDGAERRTYSGGSGANAVQANRNSGLGTQ